MITGFVNFRTILNRLYSELDINTEIVESDVITWCSDALLMIGAFNQYNEYKVELVMDKSMVKLPDNFHSLIRVEYGNLPLSWVSNNNKDCYACSTCTLPTCDTGYNFYIDNCHLITNIDTLGKLVITYVGIPVDEEGYPLIPENIYYYKALVSYVIHRLDYKEWRKGNLPDKVFQKSESDWLFYVNSARGSALMPDLTTQQKLKNIWQRLIPKPFEYYNNFSNIKNPEKRHRH